uniref:Uncharacterized protein n=1 Tax=Anguilla anguilla TaxID=7936 RepID=A0A0E9T7X8_ANGAN
MTQNLIRTDINNDSTQQQRGLFFNSIVTELSTREMMSCVERAFYHQMSECLSSSSGIEKQQNNAG